MKKVFSLSAALIASIFTLNAQSVAFSWAVKVDGQSDQRSYAVATDTSRNIYYTGEFTDSTDFDPGTGTYYATTPIGNRGYISKLDPDGNFAWVKILEGTGGSSGYTVQVDDSANVYVAGYFANTVDFDPGPGIYNLTGNGGSDIFVLKLNSNGDFVWAIGIGGIDSDQANKLCLDGNSIYVTGSFRNTADFNPGPGVANLTAAGTLDVFVLKLDIAGNYQWAQRIGGTQGETGYSINTDGVGNVYTVGQFSGTCDFDPSTSGSYTMVAIGSTDGFITKLDASGNFVWVVRIGNTGSETCHGIAFDGPGIFYVTGSFTATTDFNPDNLVTAYLTPSGPGDSYICKLDSSGSYIWATQQGFANMDAGNEIALDAGGNVYVTGTYQVGNTYNDIFLRKSDSTGTVLWTGYTSGTGSVPVATSNAMSVDAWGNIVLVGYFNDTIDFDPFLASYNLYGQNTAAFVMKFGCSAAPPVGAQITGPTSVCEGSSNVYSIDVDDVATSYIWTFPAGWTANGTAPAIVATAGNSSGNIIVATTNSCGSVSDTLVVTVNPAPVVSYSQSPSIACDDATSIVLSAASPAGGTFSGTSVSGNTFDPSVAGTGTHIITYEYTDINGCSASDTSSIDVVICTDVMDNGSSGTIDIFPNPASTSIVVAGLRENDDVSIYNSLGELVLAVPVYSNTVMINLESLPVGVYQLSVQTDAQRITKVFVKQ